jgi:hypothetical protein
MVRKSKMATVAMVMYYFFQNKLLHARGIHPRCNFEIHREILSELAAYTLNYYILHTTVFFRTGNKK